MSSRDVAPLTGPEVADLPINELPFYGGWLASLSVMLELLRFMRRLRLTLDDKTRQRVSHMVTKSIFNLEELFIPAYSLLPFGQGVDWRITLDRNPLHSHDAAPHGMQLGRLRALEHLVSAGINQEINGELIYWVIEQAYLELIATLRRNGFQRADLVNLNPTMHRDFVRAWENDTEHHDIYGALNFPLDPLGAALAYLRDTENTVHWAHLGRTKAENPIGDAAVRCIQHGIPEFWQGWAIGNAQLRNAAAGYIARNGGMSFAELEPFIHEVEAQRQNPVVLAVTVGAHHIDCIERLTDFQVPGFWHLACGILVGRTRGLAILMRERYEFGCNPIVAEVRDTLAAMMEIDLQMYAHMFTAIGAARPDDHSSNSAFQAGLIAREAGGR